MKVTLYLKSGRKVTAVPYWVWLLFKFSGNAAAVRKETASFVRAVKTQEGDLSFSRGWGPFTWSWSLPASAVEAICVYGE